MDFHQKVSKLVNSTGSKLVPGGDKQKSPRANQTETTTTSDPSTGNKFSLQESESSWTYSQQD